MKLTLNRKPSTEYSTPGELSIGDKFECFTLEPPVRIDKPNAIAVGEYRVVIVYSPKHGRMLPILQDVPDHNGIEIQIGNYPEDTLGCILVGKEEGVDHVIHSYVAFNEVFSKISNAIGSGDTVTITIQ